mgnify:CR=1 FL=1
MDAPPKGDIDTVIPKKILSLEQQKVLQNVEDVNQEKSKLGNADADVVNSIFHL